MQPHTSVSSDFALSFLLFVNYLTYRAVGQADELEGLEEKAIKTGASKLYVLDLTDEYVND